MKKVNLIKSMSLLLITIMLTSCQTVLLITIKDIFVLSLVVVVILFVLYPIIKGMLSKLKNWWNSLFM